MIKNVFFPSEFVHLSNMGKMERTVTIVEMTSSELTVYNTSILVQDDLQKMYLIPIDYVFCKLSLMTNYSFFYMKSTNEPAASREETRFVLKICNRELIQWMNAQPVEYKKQILDDFLPSFTKSTLLTSR